MIRQFNWPDADILIVDDDDNSRYLLRGMLARIGYTGIRTANSGNEALLAARSQSRIC